MSKFEKKHRKRNVIIIILVILTFLFIWVPREYWTDRYKIRELTGYIKKENSKYVKFSGYNLDEEEKTIRL
jgi:hypothetical protein